MRKLLSLGVAAFLAVAVAGVANAAPLKWEGTLKLELGTLPTVFFNGNGVATVNGSSGFGHLSTVRVAGGITGATSVPITDPDTLADGIVEIQVTATLGTGTFGAISGGGPITPDTLPIPGVARVCLFDPACNPGGFLPLDLTFHTAGSFDGGLGVGGLLTIGGAGAIRISIIANPWTLGQASAVDQTANFAFVTLFSTGFAHGPGSLTSSTALPSGVVKFVTPLQVSTNLTTGSNEVLSLFGSLKLHFVPEPGMLLLLGSGVVGLALLGRHRMKK